MITRHQKQINQPLVTSTLCLNRFLVDKSTQARKIVQWCYIEPILKEAQQLFVNATNMLDGLDTKDAAIQNVYNIQKQTVLVFFLEKDNRKIVKSGKKKHYGFDANACAHIDEMCDGILEQLTTKGQNHKPYDRG